MSVEAAGRSPTLDLGSGETAQAVFLAMKNNIDIIVAGGNIRADAAVYRAVPTKPSRGNQNMESARAVSPVRSLGNTTESSPFPLVLWRADPHEYGFGKIHIIDPDDSDKTLCGKRPSSFSGRRTDAVHATCIGCVNGVATRQKRNAQDAESRRNREACEQRREEELDRRRQLYRDHLASPEWRELRLLVLKRCNGICEGCGRRPASEVHHLTYVHLGEEFLWELRAVCGGCHSRFHGKPER